MQLSRGRRVTVLAALAISAFAAALSSESLTLTTSYPAPSGVYQALIVTGQAILARDTATNGGRVGIGTGAPASLLDVNGAAQLRGSPGGTGLTVTAAGVGVGTAGPAYPLDVAGTVNATNLLKAGAPLTIFCQALRMWDYATGGAGYQLTFHPWECNGPLDSSYVGAANSVNICGGMIDFTVVNPGEIFLGAPGPGVWFWGNINPPCQWSPGSAVYARAVFTKL